MEMGSLQSTSGSQNSRQSTIANFLRQCPLIWNVFGQKKLISFFQIHSTLYRGDRAATNKIVRARRASGVAMYKCSS